MRNIKHKCNTEMDKLRLDHCTKKADWVMRSEKKKKRTGQEELTKRIAK